MIENKLDKEPRRLSEADAPMVEEALAAVGSRSDDEPDLLAMEELGAMRAEVARMKESLGELAWASGRMARAGAATLREEMEEHIRARPIAAIGLAAMAGYIYGATR